MKMKFPVEAFALAMVVSTFGLKNAFVTGILLLFITIAGCVINDLLNFVEPKWAKISSVCIATLAITYSVFQITFIKILSIPMTKELAFLQLIMGALVCKFVVTKEDTDYNELLKTGATYYGILMILACIREFLSIGTIFDFTVGKYAFTAKSLQSIMFGFIFAGIGIALANAITKDNLKGFTSLYVVIPALLIFSPVSINGFIPLVNTFIGILLPVFLLLSVIKRLTFSSLSKSFRGLPIELVSLGFICMILSCL